VSAGNISSLHSQNSGSNKKQFSFALKKKRKNVDPSDNSSTPKYSAVEISEEDSDDEAQHKLATPLLIQFNALVIDNTRSQIQAISPFNKHYTYNSTQRHLEFRVFRI
jgi:hypothetical protein